MTRRYDMLVIDLDGTLLGPDGAVSPGNAEAVDRARRAGMEIVIATGRALVESRAAIEAIGHEGVVVAAGGSMVCHASTGATLERHAMPEALVAEAAAILLEHDHKVLLLKDPAVTGYDYLAVGPAALDPASAWWFETLPVRVRFVHAIGDDPHRHDTVRAGVVATESELAPLAAWLQESLGERAFLQHWAAVTKDGGQHGIGTTHLLEVFMPDVDKWTAIRRRCDETGLSPSRVAAIGDGLNDVRLVRDAGLGVAMGNADPRVAAVADRTTAAHGDDGVAVAIDHLLAGRW